MISYHIIVDFFFFMRDGVGCFCLREASVLQMVLKCIVLIKFGILYAKERECHNDTRAAGVACTLAGEPLCPLAQAVRFQATICDRLNVQCTSKHEFE